VQERGGGGMIGRFVRLCSLAFSLFSVFYWIFASMIFEIISFVRAGEEPSTGSYLAGSAIPTILYGLICAVFLQWFARGIIKRLPD
jgi:hypothetical protein